MNYRVLTPDQREYGPVSADEIRSWAAAGRINACCLARAEGAGDWQPITLLPEFADLFTAPRPPAVSMVSSPSGSSGVSGPADNMAVAGLVMGVLSVTVGWCCCSMVPFSVLGIIFSSIALSRCRQGGRGSQDRALAIAGLVLSGAAFLLGIGSAVLVGLMELLGRSRTHHFHFRL